MANLTFEVEGMTCGGCASRITSALQRDKRISSAVIDYATRTGVVIGDASLDEISQIISSVGYKLVNKMSADGLTPQRPVSFFNESRNLMAAFFLALPVLILAMGPWDFEYNPLFQLILTTLFLLGPASGFFIRAYKQLSRGYVTMDTLVSIGMFSAWIISIVLMNLKTHHLYFESAVMIGFFVIFGKTLEDRARRASIGDVERLIKLRPLVVFKQVANNAPTEVPISEIIVGDIIYLRPGDMLALDGVIFDGQASMDESVITGESLPVIRRAGDDVPSGSVNASSVGVLVRVTKIGLDTTVERIIRLIEDAKMSRPEIQKFADRVSSVFVPIVMVISLLTCAVWLIFSDVDLVTALIRGLSVLVVACPCALGLATPVAWVAGLGLAARSGVLVRNYESLEILRKVNAIVFDKTGTLTNGVPSVVNVIEAQGVIKPDIMIKTFSALTHSSHPLARAISRWLKDRYDVSAAPLSKLTEEVAGLGVVCELKSLEKEVLRFGQPSFVCTTPPLEWQRAVDNGRSCVAVSINMNPVLLFELTDDVRPDAEETIKELKNRGLSIYVASGDKQSVVDKLVQPLVGITSASGQMSPVMKRDLVAELRDQGKIVAFIGDGINDAPALAAADVGITLGSGTDIAAHSSGLVLQKISIQTLLNALELSSRITRIIKENFFWAFFYNIAAIPIAMLGFMSPMWASAAMALSSVTVVLNALRLSSWGYQVNQ